MAFEKQRQLKIDAQKARHAKAAKRKQTAVERAYRRVPAGYTAADIPATVHSPRPHRKRQKENRQNAEARKQVEQLNAWNKATGRLQFSAESEE